LLFGEALLLCIGSKLLGCDYDQWNHLEGESVPSSFCSISKSLSSLPFLEILMIFGYCLVLNLSMKERIFYPKIFPAIILLYSINDNEIKIRL
jgi:hypothetical protein